MSVNNCSLHVTFYDMPMSSCHVVNRDRLEQQSLEP